MKARTTGQPDGGASETASPAAPAAAAAAATRREMVLLLGAGVGVAVLFGDWARYGATELIVLVAAAGLLLVTPLVRWLGKLLERVRDPGPRAVRITAGLVTLASFAVIVGVPLAQGREMIPRSHDEFMHLLQVRMLARGRLWMPPLPDAIADHLETFFVLARPVYASIYFPGASLLMTPGAWLGLPYWVMPAALSSIAVGLMYAVLTRMLDGVAGLSGAAMLLGTSIFREVALLPMSHNITLMLALSVTWAWLRWRAAVTDERRRPWRWAALAGALAGLAAITRPLEALCYVLPLVIASMPMLRRMGRAPAARSIAAGVIAGLPFIALQLAFDLGTTGRIGYMPYQLYVDTQQPRTSYGFYPSEPPVEPQSTLPQKRQYYEEFHRPIIARHRPETAMIVFLRERLPLLLMVATPHPLLLLALPLGLLGVAAARDVTAAAAMLATLPVLAIGYAGNALLLSHYFVIWLPPLIALTCLVPAGIARAFPRVAGAAPAGFAVMLLAAIVTAQPGLNPNAQQPWTSPEMSEVEVKLASLPHRPAVVLFRFGPEVNVHHEPVHNVATAWPDDTDVVRAHDLGERNASIVRYYAARQPERYFYLYDRATRELRELGRASEVAGRLGGTGAAGAAGAGATP